MSLRTRSLLPLTLAAALVAPLLVSSPADAGVRVRIGGGIHVSGHVRVGTPRARVHVRRPPVVRYRPARVRVGGSIYIGGGAYFGMRFAEPPPPPSCDCDTEVAYPGIATAPPIYVAPAPELPRFGIGVSAGQLDTENKVSGSDVALLARLRLSRGGGLELEGELAKTELEDSTRVDRRLGAGLIWNLAPRNTLSPYLVGAMGVTQVQMSDDWSTDRSYGELGVGLTYKITPRFHLGVDFRAGSSTEIERKVDDDRRIVPLTSSTPPSDEPEAYSRGRLSALIYF